MDGIMKDLRFALRMLVRTPLLSVAAILTVGVGVGSTTFAFSVVYGTLLRQPPVRDVDRLVVVQETNPSEGIEEMNVPFHDYLDLVERQRSFERLEAGYSGTINVAGDAGAPERFQGGFGTVGLLGMLGVPPLHGRTFREGDDEPGAPLRVVLGYGPWQNRFGGDPDVVGRSVRVNGETAEIIGVMPEGHAFPFNQEIWVPLRLDAAELGRREGVPLLVSGYLREGRSLEAANAELASIARQLEAEHPRANEGIGMVARPFADAFMPPQISMMMYLLTAMVAGVLLVACANVANLLMARASARQKEVAIRSAMGADRARVIRQLLTEAVVLALAGGAVGLVLAHQGLRWFQGMVAGVNKPYWIAFEVDGPALLFTFTVTLAAAVAAGTVPALRASGGSISAILRDETRGSSSLRVGRFSSGLVVAELAVSCGLMIAAGLLVRGLVELNTLELGFEPEGVMTSRLGLFETDYPDPGARSRFYHDVLARVRSDPGVDAASLASGLPAVGQPRWPVQVDGETYASPPDVPRVGGTTVTTGYFETYGIPILEGRSFRGPESRRGGEPVAVVNRSFVERHLGPGSALGRRIRIGAVDSTAGEWMRIVGVVGDVHPGVGFFGSGDVVREAVYRPLGTADSRFMSLAVRTRGAPGAYAPRLREAVMDVDPNLPLYWVRTMETALEESTFVHRLFGTLFAVFAAAALFLAAVGLYGVIDFSVSTRIREMGVRIAFGADAGEVLGLVYGRVLRQLAVGLTAGVALGALLARPLSATLFGVEGWDAVVYAVIVGTMVTTALVAALRPALRAIRVDPMEALVAE